MALTLHGTVADNTAVLSRPNAKPFIINGDFAVAQRGTSADGTSAYLIDRWKKQAATTGNVAVSQDTDAPAGFINSQKMLASGASSFFQTGQQIEYKNFYPLLGKAASLSFYYKSDVDVIIRIRTGTSTADSVVLFTSSVASTATVSPSADWVQYVHNFSVATNVTSLSIEFATGTLANTDFVFLAGVQLEQGTFDANSIAPFQHESFGDNLARCQRYLYDPLRGTTDAFGVLALGVCLSTTVCRTVIFAPAEMRTTPTIVTSGAIEVAGDSFGPTVTSTAVSGRTGTQAMEVQFNVGSGLTSGEGAIVRRENNASTTFRLDAEL